MGTTTHTTTRSLAFSLGFGYPILTNSNQHSEKTDTFGIGVSLLMGLMGEPASGLLTKWEDALAEFVEEGRTAPSSDYPAAPSLSLPGPRP